MCKLGGEQVNCRAVSEDSRVEEVQGDLQSELKMSLQAVSTAEDCLLYRPRLDWGLARFKMGYCRMMPRMKENRIQGRKTDIIVGTKAKLAEIRSDYNMNRLQ